MTSSLALVLLFVGSGTAALISEVVWTRFLALLFGVTVYAFSIMLAVFLIGLGIGSTAAAAWARRLTRPALWLGWAQLASVVGMVWSAHALSNVLPYWPPSDAGAVSIWAVFRVDFLRAVFAILPAPLFWGASFSLALAASSDDTADQGDVVGRLYAANTIGAIAGALVTSLVLVRWFGSQHAHAELVSPPARSASTPPSNRSPSSTSSRWCRRWAAPTSARGTTTC